jgi:di/tricarboxylate transporter
LIVADSTIVFLVLGGVVVLLVLDRLPGEIVALSGALTLWATDVLELEQALAGFGNSTVIFVASLLVVATALDATGVTAWAGQLLVAAGGGDRPRRLTIAMMTVAAVLTSVITVHGAVAAMIPVVVATAARVGIPASKLLIPLAFAAHAGSQLTLTGSQVNILYSEAARDAGAGYFGYFEYALVGVPLLAGTILIVATLGPRLLPDRAPSRPQPATTELVIPPGSAMIGVTVEAGGPTSPDGNVVLVVHRDGVAESEGPMTIAAGDVLLVRGDWRSLADDLDHADVLVVDRPGDRHLHAVPWGPGARRTVAVVAALVVLLATGAVPPAVAGLAAAGALVVTRVLSIDAAYRGINWPTVVLIAAMIPISTAMKASGAADDIADAITRVVGDAGPYALLTVMFVVVAALTQMMSNTATALVAIPIGVSAAADLDVSVQPVLMSLNAVTIAALLTPVATAANTMVLRPGHYRFGDYGKLGLPLLAWWFVVAVGLVPLIWRF